jgi:hypothetical protein
VPLGLLDEAGDDQSDAERYQKVERVVQEDRCWVTVE